MVEPVIGGTCALGKDGACIPAQGAVGCAMESAQDFWTAKALLDWQLEMGVDECIGDSPVDRYALPDEAPKKAGAKAPAAPAPTATPAAAPAAPKPDAVSEAKTAAAGAGNLAALRMAVEDFAHCALKSSARATLFDAGSAGAPVMVLTDPPSAEDDRSGVLLSGPDGALFDRMFAAIGRSRDGDAPLYIAPVLPWCPPRSREPDEAEYDMMRPFLLRQIELAAPRLLVLMGNGPCQSLLGRSGISRMRGTWAEVAGLPALPMMPPSLIMGDPRAKRDAWADLLALKAKGEL